MIADLLERQTFHCWWWLICLRGKPSIADGGWSAWEANLLLLMVADLLEGQTFHCWWLICLRGKPSIADGWSAWWANLLLLMMADLLERQTFHCWWWLICLMGKPSIADGGWSAWWANLPCWCFSLDDLIHVLILPELSLGVLQLLGTALGCP